ncbi:MAG: RDD family protein [Acidobacteriota bacterium]
MTCKSCGSVMRPGTQICHECQYNQLLRRPMGDRRKTGVDQPADPVRPIIRRRSEVETVSQADVEGNLIRFPYTDPVPATPLDPLTRRETESVPEWRQQLRDRVRQSRERRGVVNDEIDDPSRSTTPAQMDEVLADRNPIVEAALKRINKASSTVTALPVNRASEPHNANSHITSRSSAVKAAVEPERKPSPPTPQPERPVVKQTTMENVRSVPPAPEERVAPPPTGSGSSSLRREKIRPRVAEMSLATTPTPPIPPTPVVEATAPESALEVKPSPRPRSTPEKVAARPEEVAPPTEEAAAVAAKPTISVEAEPVTPPPVSVPASSRGDEHRQSVAEPEQGPRPDPGPRKIVSRPVRTTGKLRPEDLPVATQIIEVPQVFDANSPKKGQAATFWVRTLAGGCDFEIVALSFLPIFASYAILNTVLESETLLLMVILLSGLSFIYYAVTLLMAGRTFGMAMLNLRLIPLNAEAEGVTRQQRLLRAWASTIALLLPPLNLLVRVATAPRLSLHDLISKTIPVEN